MELPISWVRSKTDFFQFQTIPLKSTKLNWISLAEVPTNVPFEEVLSQLQNSYPRGILIRGCTPQVAKKLSKQNFEVIPIGREAILDLNGHIFEKKSLRELINRGSRNASIKKVIYNKTNIVKLEKLKRLSVHGKKPQLTSLFINSFQKNTECFICENYKGEWIAAITYSQVNEFKVQAELMLRVRNAPNGTMEALIENIAASLKGQGFNSWSLGEVPFLMESLQGANVKSLIINLIGKKLKMAYNAESLYNFKNKFNPKWQPVFLCGYPNVSLLSILEMAYRSKYIELIIWYISRKLTEKLYNPF